MPGIPVVAREAIGIPVRTLRGDDQYSPVFVMIAGVCPASRGRIGAVRPIAELRQDSWPLPRTVGDQPRLLSSEYR